MQSKGTCVLEGLPPSNSRRNMHMGLQVVLSVSLALLSLVCTGARATAVPSDSVHRVFTSDSPNLNNTKLRYVNNSGICETTPGVHQVSGYIDIGKNMSIVSSNHSRPSKQRHVKFRLLQWFWFFEARHSPENSPFTMWCQSFLPGKMTLLTS